MGLVGDAKNWGWRKSMTGMAFRLIYVKDSLPMGKVWSNGLPGGIS